MMDELVTYIAFDVRTLIEKVVPKEQQFKEQPNVQEVMWDTWGEI